LVQNELENLEEPCSKVLVEIYISQNVRDEGVLQSTSADWKNHAGKLIEKGLIRENHWYSHSLYLTTPLGANIARSLIEKKIENCEDTLHNLLLNFSPRCIGFLVHDYLIKSLDFPKDLPEYIFDYWLNQSITILVTDPRIWSIRTHILSKLEEFGLCIRTNYYVSTRGGELREMRYVICSEVRELLLEISPALGLTADESRNCRVHLFLKEIAVWLSYPDLEATRKRYLNEMQRLDIDEVDIKNIINELAAKGVTERYIGIDAVDKKPFAITDQVRYSFCLQNLLVKPIIANLLESKSLGLEHKAYDQTEILHRVVRLVEAKYTLTRNAGFLGIDLFDSTTDIEICIIHMIKVPTTEGELKEFIETLYNYLIDRSKDWLLKIGNLKNGEITSLEKEIKTKGKTIPPEWSAGFEKAIQDLRVVNNLRNKLSHSKAAKDWEEIGNIYRKLINKPLPQSKEDFIDAQVNLLDKAALSLESLSQMFNKITV
jgi:hypothetical protein